jgi:hypothetical protein
MNHSIRFKLFIMMVLEFFIWGAWLPLIFGYLPSLGFSPAEQSWILNAFPLAAIVGMFFSNQYADRHFAAEKFLAFSHVIGGLAMLGLAFTKTFWPFFGLMLVHCLLYVPTLSITNSIAFAHMKNPQKEFGLVRMGGTLGWILAAWPFTFILVDWDKVHAANPDGFVKWLGTVLSSGLAGDALLKGTRWTFVVAGAAALALSAFSLILPHTPPRRIVSGDDRFAWLESIKLLKLPFVLVLWLVTCVDAVVHNAYFNWAGTFLGTPSNAGRWHSWQLDYASNECRPGGGDVDDAYPGGHAETTRLADHDDCGYPCLPGSLRGLGVPARPSGLNHRGAGVARNVLRVFLRYRLYFCG